MPKPSKRLTPDWDSLVTRFNTPAFIQTDPVSFAHQWKTHTDWRNAECIGFIAALFSYGRRDLILKTVNQIVTTLGDNPVETLLTSTPTALAKQHATFYYRFNKGPDLVFLLSRMGEIYRRDDSLRDFWKTHATGNIAENIHAFRQAFLYGGNHQAKETYGLKFLFADPALGSAAKRFNMFLRWMSRHDDVDLGLWQTVLHPQELIIPLDTHVAHIARHYQITQRNANDWRTAEAITDYFRQLCPTDPVKYDFALFGLGIAQAEEKRA